MTPILKGTASRLGLRKPQPSLAQQIVSFMRHHVPHYVLEPWQVYAVERWCERPDYMAHFEIHPGGRVVDNMERLRSRENGNANL